MAGDDEGEAQSMVLPRFLYPGGAGRFRRYCFGNFLFSAYLSRMQQGASCLEMNKIRFCYTLYANKCQ